MVPVIYLYAVLVYTLLSFTFSVHLEERRVLRGEESSWTTASHSRQKQRTNFFLAPFIYSRMISCDNRAQLVIAWSNLEGMGVPERLPLIGPLLSTPDSTSWLTRVLFVATTTYTISVYYFSMCTVCGHYHVYY